MARNPASELDDWRILLHDTLEFTRQAAFPEPVIAVLERYIGNPLPQEWRLDGIRPSYNGELSDWQATARELIGMLDKQALAPIILRTVDKALRIEEIRATHLTRELLQFGREEPAPTRLAIDAAWNCISYSVNAVLVTSLKRQPPLDEENALRLFRRMRKAMLFWAGDFVAEPDIPYKSLLAWLATQSYRNGAKLAPLAADIATLLGLMPAADAADRKYLAHMQASMETLRLKLGSTGPAAG